MNQPQTRPDDDFARLTAALRASWPAGERLRVEELLGKEAGFQPSEAQLLELLYEEFLARRQAGERPAPAEYLTRFPAHRAALERLFALHAELGDELNSQQALTRLGLDGRTVEFSHDEPAAERTGAFGPPRAKKPREGDLVRYLGDYELLREIARGGMGVVYQARQVALKRVVALKMILSGDFASAAEVRRFHTEAESAAQLDHPHIVPIYEVGEHEGLHYFSMGYVDGPPLSSRLTDGPLPPREAAALVRTVCQAVHYAHTQGVIHRDLKPGNILLDRDGQPRVTDFGLAKRSQGDSSLTGTGHIVGTPSYMPPEQASGRNELTREPADVYALGAVLYATLTGRPPFQADNPLDTLRQVLEREPVAPRQLNPAVPLDLETICLKCLEKSIPRRYASAQAVADELERFLEGKPIQARPIGRSARAWRWCKRNPVVASLLAAVATSLFVGAVVSSIFAVKATNARHAAEDNARLANQEAANLALNEAANHCADGEANIGLLWMARAHRLATTAGDADLADACRAMASGWLADVPRLEMFIRGGPHPVARFGPDDRTIIVALNSPGNARLQVYEAASGKLLQDHPGPRLEAFFLAVSPDRKLALLLDEAAYRFWSVEEGRYVGDAMAVSGQLTSAAFSPDGATLATATADGAIQIWDVPSGAARTSFSEPQIGSPPQVCRICFTPDGAALWIAGNGRRLACRRVLDGEAVRPVFDLQQSVFSLAAAPGGRQLILGTGQRWIVVLDVSQSPPREVRRIPAQLEYDHAVHPNGVHLLSGGRGESNEARYRAIRDYFFPSSAPMTFQATVTGVQLAQSAEVALVSYLEGVEIWRQPEAIARDSPIRLNASERKSQFVPQEMRLVTLAPDQRSILVLRLPTGEVEREFAPCDEQLLQLAADPQASIALAVDARRRLRVLDLQTGAWRSAAEPLTEEPLSMEVALGARRACVRMPNFAAQLWDLTRCAPLALPDLRSLELPLGKQFDPTGRWLWLMDHSARTGTVIDAQDGSVYRSWEFGRNPKCAAFHPDGRRLVVGLSGGDLVVCDLRDGRQSGAVGKHDGNPNAVYVTADGRFALSTGIDAVVRCWDLERGLLQGAPVRNTGRVRGCIPISRDSRLGAFYSPDSQVRLFHLRTGRIVSPQIPLFGSADAELWFAPDSRTLYSALYTGKTAFSARPLPDVPHDQAQLKLFVEAWTGLTLEENDVRVLPRDEWQRRRQQLRDVGWEEAPRAPSPESQDVRPVDLRTAAPVATWPAHPGARLWEVVFSPDGTRLATSTTNPGGWKLWDGATHELVRSFAEPYAALDGLSFTADGRRLVAGHRKGLAWWNLETGAEEHHVTFDQYVSGIAIAPDQSVVAAMVRESRRVFLFDLATATPGRTLEIPMPDPVPGSRSVSQACFSPDGSLLIAACGGRGWPDYLGADAVIAIWETRTWKLLAGFPANQNDVLDLAISPDSQWLATADGRLKTTKLWNLSELLARTDQTPQPDAPPTRVLPSTHSQTSVAFSPDGVWLVAGGEAPSRGCVTLHRLAEDQTFIAPIDSGALAMTFSPDGTQLATTSIEGTVSLWNFRDLVGE